MVFKFFVFCLVVLVPVLAAADVFTIQDIVVTATKTEKNIIDAPASVSVISNEMIQMHNTKRLDELTGMVTGVFNRRTKATDIMPTINIRGLYGYNRNLILVDGQQVVEWRRIPINENNIERIEVIKGPFSALYGDNAMGGVVNIITKKPSEKFAGAINLGYETYNTKSIRFGLSGMISNNFGFSLSGQKYETDGYVTNYVIKTPTTTGSEATVTGAIPTTTKAGAQRFLVGDKGKNYYSDESISLKLNYTLNNRHYFEGTYTYTDNEYGYDGGPSYLYDDTGTMIKSGNVFIDDDGTIKRVSLSPFDFESDYGGAPTNIFNLTYKYLSDNYTLKLSGGSGEEDYWYVYPTTTSYKMTNLNKKSNYLAEINWFDFNSHNLIAGIDISLNSLDSDRETVTDWKNKGSVVSPPTEIYGGESNITGLFLQDEFDLSDNITVYGGLRYSIWKAEKGYEKYQNYPGVNYDAQTKNSLDPKIAIVYSVSDNLKLRTSFGTGFNTPTAYDLYKRLFYGAYVSLGNPDLNPEKVKAFEIGANYFPDSKTRINAAVFVNRMSDYIYRRNLSAEEVMDINVTYGTNYDTVSIHSSNNIKDNIGSASTKGIEFDFQRILTSKLLFNFNATYISSEVLKNPANPSIEGNKLPFVPSTMYNASLNYIENNYSLMLSYNYKSEYYSDDGNTDRVRGIFAGYDKVQLLDAKVSYNVNDYITVSLLCGNLLDREYYTYYKASEGRTFGLFSDIKF